MKSDIDYEQLYYDTLYENRKLKNKISELEFAKIYNVADRKEKRWENQYKEKGIKSSRMLLANNV